MTGVIDVEKTRTPVGNVVDLQGVLAGPVSHGLCLANERPEAAFVTLNHIQTIDDKVRRAEAACRLGKGDSCNLRALRGGLTRALPSHPLHIAASLGCLVDLGEVTSLDVGLVALHQAQRYAVLC
ncbi:TPA: hypothetical protein F3L18_16910 [Aeromonas hydrophila]|nr:hypothetical protein [Aeromonas hydrophila]HAU4858836.1 hypothetical protein [Aeromonas hydrophila]HAU4862418.1 hypothetical protein [Aeromonas hydrophila]HAU4867915.1 hypothetical protein [Aeromonas hydrophila]HAU4879680.1 hypothetical protein [Aeromonas hydrophila]